MRKYLLNGALLSSVFAIVPTIKQAQMTRSRWATIAAFVAWGASVAIAIAAVRDQAEEERLEAEGRR